MNKLSLGVASGVLAAIVLVTPAFAWSFKVNGDGQCQKDGSYKITWVISNKTEPQPLIITKVQSSSNAAILPAPTTVAAGKDMTYVQTVSGTKLADYTLKITGHWKGDKSDHTYTGKASLCKICKQPEVPTTPPVEPPVTPPVTPPAGGMGGGTTADTTPAPAAPVVTTPQVVIPAGPVSAGNGGAPKMLSLASIVGLIGSVSALGFGIRGFKKQA